jgi:hypothetical protein
MTPLAHRITRDLVRHDGERLADFTLATMADIHCFEVSEVTPLAVELSRQIVTGASTAAMTFLPAPKTWIEWTSVDPKYGFMRIGHLLEEHRIDDRPAFATVKVVWEVRRVGLIQGHRAGNLRLDEPEPDGRASTSAHMPSAEDLRAFLSLPDDRSVADWSASIAPYCDGFLYAFLAMINSPRLIGRREHNPHIGFERELMAKRALVGRFPLHAWTEIKLEVSPPEWSGESDASHLTGHKALHFCRAHARIRLGRLEFVRGHWRGDAALGIKRSRYRVIPAKRRRVDA